MWGIGVSEGATSPRELTFAGPWLLAWPNSAVSIVASKSRPYDDTCRSVGTVARPRPGGLPGCRVWSGGFNNDTPARRLFTCNKLIRFIFKAAPCQAIICLKTVANLLANELCKPHCVREACLGCFSRLFLRHPLCFRGLCWVAGGSLPTSLSAE